MSRYAPGSTGGAHWDGGGATSAADVLAALENTELPPGARDYWAFQLPVQAPVPVSSTFEHPVDRFLDAARRAGGVTAAPRADGLPRLRRAYLDLIGLPPTPEQIDEFLADTDRGAWERLIDRLLDSPHYGERWGRHWMDVARYADSTGFEQDYTRPNAWRYRDYVINAFNRDGSSHKCVHDSAPAGRPRRGKRVRMRSCQLTSGAVVCRSVDGRLRGPRF